MEGTTKEEKGFLGKVKDIAEDKEHQIEFLGTIVRLGVVKTAVEQSKESLS